MISGRPMYLLTICCPQSQVYLRIWSTRVPRFGILVGLIIAECLPVGHKTVQQIKLWAKSWYLYAGGVGH